MSDFLAIAFNFVFTLVTSLGVKIISAVIILIAGFAAIKWFKKWILNSAKTEKIDAGVRTFLASFVTIALYAVLFVSIAMVLGVPTTSFVTALASCGVAIGLAMQGSLSNFAGGIMLLLFKPFKVGDFIESNGVSGTVTDITVVYTIIHTVDNKVITIPNGSLTNSVIVNASCVDTRRVDFTFSAGYECDIDKVKEILNNVALSHELVDKEREPFVALGEHGDSALIYILRVWCNADDYWKVKFDINEKVKKEFDKNGISIPYPQMDVHLNTSEQ